MNENPADFSTAERITGTVEPVSVPPSQMLEFPREPVLPEVELRAFLAGRNYRVGVPRGGFWGGILNSDAKEYGDKGEGNYGGQNAGKAKWHGRPFSLSLTLPPLATLFFASREPAPVEAPPIRL